MCSNPARFQQRRFTVSEIFGFKIIQIRLTITELLSPTKCSYFFRFHWKSFRSSACFDSELAQRLPARISSRNFRIWSDSRIWSRARKKIFKCALRSAGPFNLEKKKSVMKNWWFARKSQVDVNTPLQIADDFPHKRRTTFENRFWWPARPLYQPYLYCFCSEKALLGRREIGRIFSIWTADLSRLKSCACLQFAYRHHIWW